MERAPPAQVHEILPKSGLVVSEKGQLTEVTPGSITNRDMNVRAAPCVRRQHGDSQCLSRVRCWLQVLCKPKILPLKSVTLEKLEDMEARMVEAAKQSVPKTAAAPR